MSSSDTLMAKISSKLPYINPSDYFSLVLCGNIEKGYDGLCGVVVDNLTLDKHYEAFFGNFTDKLLEWEKMPPWRVNTEIQAPEVTYDLFRWVGTYSKHPIFISPNIKNWAEPVLEDMIKNQPIVGKPKYELIELRDMYEAFQNDGNYSWGKFSETQKIGDLFPKNQLPVHFGLAKIFTAMGCDRKNIPYYCPYPLTRSKQICTIANIILNQL